MTDRYNLKRFLDAQEDMYDIALSEIQKGKKYSHWMWYIFPQLVGLGFSEKAKYYGISGLDEAKAYLDEPTLRQRLIEISEAVYNLDGSMMDVFRHPDDYKLQSCMTLFEVANPAIDVFARVLEKHYAGERDAKTLELLR